MYIRWIKVNHPESFELTLAMRMPRVRQRSVDYVSNELLFKKKWWELPLTYHEADAARAGVEEMLKRGETDVDYTIFWAERESRFELFVVIDHQSLLRDGSGGLELNKAPPWWTPKVAAKVEPGAYGAILADGVD